MKRQPRKITGRTVHPNSKEARQLKAEASKKQEPEFKFWTVLKEDVVLPSGKLYKGTAIKVTDETDTHYTGIAPYPGSGDVPVSVSKSSCADATVAGLMKRLAGETH
jgi:hypothetical protein